MADNAFDQANLAFDKANTAYTEANIAFSQANAAFIKANTASGGNQQIQFNDGGSFAGNSQLTYDKTTGTLTVKNLSVDDDITLTNNLNINGDIVPSELGQNIGLPNQRWYNLYMDGGIYANGTFGNPGQFLSVDGYGVVRWMDPPSANIDGNVVVYATDVYARDTANDAYVLAQAAYNKANTAGTGVDQYARNTANTAYNNTVLQQGVNSTQNTNITRTDTKAQAAFDKANTATNNASSGSLYANNALSLAQAAYNTANSASATGIDQYARDTANTAYASTEAQQSVNLSQNTKIEQADTKAQSAYNTANTAVSNASSASSYANSGITIAQAAFEKANAASSSSIDQVARNTANTAYDNTFYLQSVNATQNTTIQNTGVVAQASFNKANLVSGVANSGYNQANSATILAQAAFDKANTGGGSAVDAWARDQANSAISQTNILQWTNNTQNTSIINVNTLAQAAFDQANTNATSSTLAQAAFNKANSANVLAQSSYNQANSAATYANTGITIAQSAYDFANALTGGTATDGWARQRANAAFDKANSAYSSAALAAIQSLSALNDAAVALTTANAAYDAANTKVDKSGDTMTGVLSITDSSSSISVTTGALQVSGGVGVSGNVYANMFYSNNYAGIIDAGSF